MESGIIIYNKNFGSLCSWCQLTQIIELIKFSTHLKMLDVFITVQLCLQVRDELEQLLDDDDDMADLYLSRKFASSSSPGSDFGLTKWQLVDDEFSTIERKISKSSSRASATTTHQEINVEELEMLLEVIEWIRESTSIFDLNVYRLHKLKCYVFFFLFSLGLFCPS